MVDAFSRQGGGCDLRHQEFAGKTVIITGAGRGIGRAIALEFACAGAITVLAARTRTQLEDVASEIESVGSKTLVVPTDVTIQEEVQHLVKETVGNFGCIDILVNNAGTNYVSSLLLSDDCRWQKAFNVNVFGVYRCTKAVLPHMIRAKSGRVINIASVAGQVGAAYDSVYAASKAAVIGFTKSIALEVAKLGITVNAICPWHVDTELCRAAMAVRGAMLGKDGEQYLAHIAATNPQNRLMPATETAAIALFLASRNASSINGQALNQCGGAVT